MTTQPLATGADASKALRVIVCGGRDYWKAPADATALYLALDLIHSRTPICHVFHGNAHGADALAGNWAYRRGVRCTAVPARWKEDGKSAGPRRNARMLGQGIDLVIAFPGGRGADNMIRLARRASVRVVEPLCAGSESL